MSEENDKATEAEEAGKKALEEQKAADAEKIGELQDAELTEDEAKAEREAREAETKAQQDADDAAEDAAQKEAQAAAEAQKEELKAEQAADDAAEAAYQEQAKKDQEARQAELQAEQDADDAAEDAFQEQAKKDQEKRQEELEKEQAAYEKEQEDARREAMGDDRTDEERAADEARYQAALDALSEEQNEDQSLEADEDEIGFEETTAVEDLEQAWDESGFMGVYSSRTDLFNKLTSNWFSWFPPVRRFPEINFNFIVMAGLDFLGEFKSVSGIGKSLPAFEVEEGGRHHSPHYLPFKGPASREQLKLEWGSVSATSLYEWIQAVRIGWAFHRDVIVVQLSRDGWPTRIMRFGNCWPTAWSGADLDTGGSSWALQSLNLVYDDFNMITIPFDLGAMARGG